MILGRQEGNWVALTDEPGYMMISNGSVKWLARTPSSPRQEPRRGAFPHAALCAAAATGANAAKPECDLSV